MELADRDSLEADFAADLGRLTQKQHAELRRLLGNPPNADNVPAAFWEKAKKEREEILTLFLIAMATENAIRHSGSAAGSVRQTISTWGASRAKEVASGFVERSKGTVASQVSAGANSRDAASAAFNDSRDSGLATTETTAASVYGGEQGAASVGILSDEDIWEIHPELSESGVCPVCEPFANQPRSVWGKVHPSGPPLHPNCKCRIRYVGSGSNSPPPLPRPLPQSSGPNPSPVQNHPAYAAVVSRGIVASANARMLGISGEQLAVLKAMDGATLNQVNRRMAGRSTAMPRETARGLATLAKSAVLMLAASRRGALFYSFGDSQEWQDLRTGQSIHVRGFLHMSSSPQGTGRHLLVVENPQRAKSMRDVLPDSPADAIYPPGARFQVVSREVRGTSVVLRVREI